MIEIKYVCSNGKEYNLVGDRMRPTSGYFHDYEWKPMTTDQEIGADVYGFEKEPKTYQITLTFRGPLEERKAKMDELEGNIDLGDIVGGKDYLTGISMKKPIGRKIWTISSGKEKVVYKLEGET